MLSYTSDSSSQKAAVLAAEIEQRFSVKAEPVQADISSEDGPSLLVETAKKAFAPSDNDRFQIDIIINNAAVVEMATIGNISAEQFQSQVNLNVRGPIFLIQAAMPYLPTDRSGRVVGVSSISSNIGFWGQTVYGATKAALEAMSRVWARELSENATFNTVSAGAIDTGMYGELSDDWLERLTLFSKLTPLSRVREGIDSDRVRQHAAGFGGRAGYPEEIAGVIGMLCLPEAGWTTGSIVCANGGCVFIK